MEAVEEEGEGKLFTCLLIFCFNSLYHCQLFLFVICILYSYGGGSGRGYDGGSSGRGYDSGNSGRGYDSGGSSRGYDSGGYGGMSM